MTVRARIKWISALSAAVLALFMPMLPALAQESQASEQAVPDIVDEDFVIASLLVSEPGDFLYSRLGHAALHMRCPEHGLDYVFTYESEDVRTNPIKFLSGKLRMGLVAVSPEAYLSAYEAAGRGVKEYTLNIPVERKRELWRVLDNHMMEGLDIKFDFLKRGCAHSCLSLIREGLGDTKMEFGQWPEYFEGATRREITYEHLKDFKWATFILHFICNGAIDRTNCSNEEKVIIPADLPFVLSHATIDGVPVISEEPEEVLPSVWKQPKVWFTPILAVLILLALTIVCIFLKSSVMDYVLLGIQTILGLAALYLLLFSSLICTDWSWLIIPFNPLPLIFWKWRRHWALPYAVILLVWAAFMLFSPHLLTDPAYIILATAFIASYINIYIKSRKINSL